MDEHTYHLELVFEVLREHKLYANKKKCSFAFQKVEYLGHIVSGQGMEVDPEKIKSIKTMASTNKHEGVAGISRDYWILQEICAKLWLYCSSFNSSIEIGSF